MGPEFLLIFKILICIDHQQKTVTSQTEPELTGIQIFNICLFKNLFGLNFK